MHVDIRSRVALVTGGAHGIGRAIAQVLAANGASVAIVDIDATAAERTAAQISAEGGACRGLAGDVADAPSMQAAADAIVSQWDGIDILVNNAGVNTTGGRMPIDGYSDEDWHRILRVDLTGVFVTSRIVVPIMRRGGGGRIVNIGSVAGLVPLRLQSAFVAAKAGVANLTRSMALELGPDNILVNCVAPGSTLTPGTEALFYGEHGAYSEKAAALLAHIPLGRPASTAEIASAVLFLVAPEASYVNGAVLPVDGGWTAGYIREF